MNPVRSPWQKNFNKIFLRWTIGVIVKIMKLPEINYFGYIKADF